MKTGNEPSKRRLWQVMLCSILLGTILISFASAQVANDKTLYRVPSAWRARLVDRMNLYISYERTNQYEKLAEMSPDAYGTKQETKDWFANLESYNRKYANDANERNASVRAFTVLSVKRDRRRSKLYLIAVREELEYGGRMFEYKSTYEAYFENGDWYFAHPRVDT